jgi:hypothetical protein
MSTAEMEEKKRLIIQEIQLVEDEWILKAIEKLLDLDDLSEIAHQDRFDIKQEGKAYTIDSVTENFSLMEEDWKKIEKDEEDFIEGKGANYSWKEVKNLILNDGK